MTDPAGDCEFAPGNQYMDVVAAWISDETPNDLNVNIQLASWVPVVSEGAGFAVQFRHQGVRFGVLAGHIAQTWSYGNGEVNEEGEIISFNDTTGSFQQDPPIITILFVKSNFPHGDMSDNQLVEFTGGSIDLKPIEPFFFSPAAPPASPPVISCDTISGSIPYTFQTGDHSQHSPGASSASAASNQTGEPGEVGAIVVDPAAQRPAPEETQSGVPGPGLGLVALALVGLALLRRR